MKTQTRIAPSFKLSVIACITSLIVVPEEAFAVWCQDWQERQRNVIVLDTKDVRWNGETLSLRYWSESGQQGLLELVYWTKDGKKQKANAGLFGTDGSMSFSSEWRGFSADLRYAPSRYQLTRVNEYCENVREPTLWERISQ